MIVATTIIIIITIVTIVTIVTILLSLLVKDDAILHCSLYQSRGQRKINMERYWVWWFGFFFFLHPGALPKKLLLVYHQDLANNVIIF